LGVLSAEDSEGSGRKAREEATQRRQVARGRMGTRGFRIAEACRYETQPQGRVSPDIRSFPGRAAGPSGIGGSQAGGCNWLRRGRSGSGGVKNNGRNVVPLSVIADTADDYGDWLGAKWREQISPATARLLRGRGSFASTSLRLSAPSGFTGLLGPLVFLLPSRGPVTPSPWCVSVASRVPLIAGRDPHGSPVRRASPAPTVPDVPLATPVPVALNPDVPPRGRGRSFLPDDRRRRLADDHVLLPRLGHVHRFVVGTAQQAQECDAAPRPLQCSKGLHGRFSFLRLRLTHLSCVRGVQDPCQAPSHGLRQTPCKGNGFLPIVGLAATLDFRLQRSYQLGPKRSLCRRGRP
jgi:hypothetical protein